MGAGALDLPNVAYLTGGGATGVTLGEVALQAARLRADHLVVDGVSDASTYDVLAAAAGHGGGAVLGFNAAPGPNAGATVCLLAALSGRGSEQAIAAIVARSVDVLVSVDRGMKVVGIEHITGASEAGLVSEALFLIQGGALVATGAEL